VNQKRASILRWPGPILDVLGALNDQVRPRLPNGQNLHNRPHPQFYRKHNCIARAISKYASNTRLSLGSISSNDVPVPRCDLETGAASGCAMPAATPWPMPAMIRGRCKIGSVTARSSIRSATPNCRRHSSRTSGAEFYGRGFEAHTAALARRGLPRPIWSRLSFLQCLSDLLQCAADHKDTKMGGGSLHVNSNQLRMLAGVTTAQLLVYRFERIK
jgi:hypothetical protein